MGIRQGTLESLDVTGFFRGKRVFLTGHTGFKGAWLVVILEHLGAEVRGYSLPPESDRQLFSLCRLGEHPGGLFGDIRDRRAVTEAMAAFDPHIVIHMAAQALVRRSYADPVGTYESNVTGTANVLAGLQGLSHCDVALIITSDKVYRNDGTKTVPFREDDPLGGKDPYSASKACTEILTASWRDSFPGGPAIATARAGNVIGGGDWASDRLVPDMIRALERGETLALRYPDAVRPWQLSLDVLFGYLAYIEALATRPGAIPRALNFGPFETVLPKVHEVVEAMAKSLRHSGDAWVLDPGEHLPEAAYLTLDTTLARETLDWTPRLGVYEALNWAAEWYRRVHDGEPARDVSADQLARFLQKAA